MATTVEQVSASVEAMLASLNISHVERATGRPLVHVVPADSAAADALRAAVHDDDLIELDITSPHVYELTPCLQFEEALHTIIQIWIAKVLAGGASMILATMQGKYRFSTVFTRVTAKTAGRIRVSSIKGVSGKDYMDRVVPGEYSNIMGHKYSIMRLPGWSFVDIIIKN
jgi:hypothetical protein